MGRMEKPIAPGSRQNAGGVIGLDVGDKTIGIALSDELGLTAQPYQTLKRKGDEQDIRALDGRAGPKGHGLFR